MRSKAFKLLLMLMVFPVLLKSQDTSRVKERKQETSVNDTAAMQGFNLVGKRNQGLLRLRSVENMGIYEGKKTEVITPDQNPVNLATNNARQVFSRVAGLNIWENDGAGLQLNVGGRGLDPNRSSNFNVRQNGYDISADALGYPESYYTPPMEAVGKIQIVRGAASLQYGTQFGGLINFQMKEPVSNKKLELDIRQSAGSFGFYNAFTAASGTVGKLSYYSCFQYKRMNGWRENSKLNSYTFYSNINYKFNARTKLGFDFTHMNYLAQQPGGLSDAMFAEDPRQTNRARNWFDVDWNLMTLHFDHKLRKTLDFNLRVFGLLAHRYSVGFRPNRVATIDNGSERDLITGEFQNYGAEARLLKKFKRMVLLSGVRYYHGFNHSVQGLGSKGSDADFKFIDNARGISNDYQFPNDNLSLFAENIIYLGRRFSITPGVRMEYIHTRASGYYNTIQFDLAGNIISSVRTDETRDNPRRFVIGGLGLSYKPFKRFEMYGNLSQNYRSITFSDMRITNPSQVIDPQMTDEHGYSMDLGLRTINTSYFTCDVSAFLLNYDNRIGEVQIYDASNRVQRLRTNIGRAVMQGVESYFETDLMHLVFPGQKNFNASFFVNAAYIHSQYKSSRMPGIEGNKVEFVPELNLKTGLITGYKNLRLSFQLTHLSEQFTDATNAREGGVSAVVGTIPSYTIMDLSLSYKIKRFRIDVSCNNLSNNMYFTRRATGYPGPGIIPSDGRSFFVTLACRL